MKFHGCFFSILILLFAGCCNNKTRITNEATIPGVTAHIARVMAPRNGEAFRCGDWIAINLQINPDSLIQIDSAVISSGAKNHQVCFSDYENLRWNSDKARVGKNVLKISLYKKGQKETHSLVVTLLSDIVPVAYRYRIVQQYPHDEDAFTQGLFYDKDVLYESTGTEGKSSLRMVSLKTGIPIKRIDLEKQFFAEGIALLNDQIYQLTYKSQVGFIYDKETLSLIRRFDYPINEGWGLTSDGKHLIMSDGSAQLYFLDPEFFTQVDQVEVFDNKGMITYLNELEYINGKVLANIWYKSIIVIIDPENGKITGQINMEKLMPQEAIDDSNKVLNGIAYNTKNGHIYVTGKYWPVLYELEIIPSL
ncbi:MAG: glutaminyl-peptide cyclotransferase [Bacteroidales bacterium]|nr:glutaminyl-peptide cyclotransferase [Bacteroidales bacterium]